MRLLIIRHADPDYERDSLTETGFREAELLAQRLSGERIDYFYKSPLGRARDTAAPLLERLGAEAETLDWLQEFDGHIERPDKPGETSICWDWLPQDWTLDERLYDFDRWLENPVVAAGDVKAQAH